MIRLIRCSIVVRIWLKTVFLWGHGQLSSGYLIEQPHCQQDLSKECVTENIFLISQPKHMLKIVGKKIFTILH